jgi:hypothetical protein
MSTLSGGPNIVTNGLVYYLDAANPTSYISGSASWNTLINTGSFTISNNTQITSSFQVNPPAIYLTQSRASSQNAINGAFPFSENLSIEVWYKTDTTASGFASQQESPGIIQIGNYASNASLTLWDWSAGTPGSHRMNTYVNNGTIWSHVASSTIAYTDAAWVGKYQHIVLNFSGSAGKWNRYNLYINSVLQSTINFTIPFPSSSIAGGNNVFTPGALGGSARNSYGVIRIYNRELTLADINQNYNANKTRFQL